MVPVSATDFHPGEVSEKMREEVLLWLGSGVLAMGIFCKVIEC